MEVKINNLMFKIIHNYPAQSSVNLAEYCRAMFRKIEYDNY